MCDDNGKTMILEFEGLHYICFYSQVTADYERTVDDCRKKWQDKKFRTLEKFDALKNPGTGRSKNLDIGITFFYWFHEQNCMLFQRWICKKKIIHMLHRRRSHGRRFWRNWETHFESFLGHKKWSDKRHHRWHWVFGWFIFLIKKCNIHFQRILTDLHQILND